MIRRITDADVRDALALAQDAIGVGWADPSDLEPGPARRVVVAEQGGRIVGVASAALVDAAAYLVGARAEVREVLEPGLSRVPRAAPLLNLDVAAVAVEAQRQGHYTAMLADRIEWGRRNGAGYAVTVGWTPSDGCHIATAVERAGFARLAEFAGFYRAASIRNGALCPECGNPCECTGIMFGLTL